MRLNNNSLDKACDEFVKALALYVQKEPILERFYSGSKYVRLDYKVSDYGNIVPYRLSMRWRNCID